MFDEEADALRLRGGGKKKKNKKKKGKGKAGGQHGKRGGVQKKKIVIQPPDVQSVLSPMPSEQFRQLTAEHDQRMGSAGLFFTSSAYTMWLGAQVNNFGTHRLDEWTNSVLVENLKVIGFPVTAKFVEENPEVCGASFYNYLAVDSNNTSLTSTMPALCNELTNLPRLLKSWWTVMQFGQNHPGLEGVRDGQRDCSDLVDTDKPCLPTFVTTDNLNVRVYKAQPVSVKKAGDKQEEQRNYCTMVSGNERVTADHLSDDAPKGPVEQALVTDVLPTDRTHKSLKMDMMCQVTRILLEHLDSHPLLKELRKQFPMTDRHFLYDAMTKPSERKEMGIILANQSDSEGQHVLAEKMQSFANTVVDPGVPNGQRILLERQFVNGDWKTSNLLVGTQKSVDETGNMYSGYLSCFMDWHAWRALFDKWWEQVYNQKHLADPNSFYHLTSKMVNLPKEITDDGEKDFNDHDDHLQAVTKGMVVAAFMYLTKMDTPESPVHTDFGFPSCMSTSDPFHAQLWLLSMAKIIVDLYVSDTFKPSTIGSVDEKQRCPYPGCKHPGFMKPKSVGKIPGSEPLSVYLKAHMAKHMKVDTNWTAPTVNVAGGKTPRVTVLQYWENIMSMGLLRMVFKHKMDIGDGHRLIYVVYKHMYPLYSEGNHTHYENELERMYMLLKYVLTPAEAARFPYSRFVLRKPGPFNIPADLDNEFYNKIVKFIIKRVSSNLTPKEHQEAVASHHLLAKVFYRLIALVCACTCTCVCVCVCTCVILCKYYPLLPTYLHNTNIRSYLPTYSIHLHTYLYIPIYLPTPADILRGKKCYWRV
jgi:hypothetical protein